MHAPSKHMTTIKIIIHIEMSIKEHHAEKHCQYKPTHTTFNDIQYYRDTITIVTCFPTIMIVCKFHYRPALMSIRILQHIVGIITIRLIV